MEYLQHASETSDESNVDINRQIYCSDVNLGILTVHNESDEENSR